MEKFVLPQLLTQEFFAAEGFDKLYRTLFTPQPPQPLVSEDMYRTQVNPFMIKLWTFRQADIRMTIFRLFEVYLKAVVMGEGGSEVLGQIILPEVSVWLVKKGDASLNRLQQGGRSSQFLISWLDFGRSSGCRPQDLFGIPLWIGYGDPLCPPRDDTRGRLDQTKVFCKVLVRTDFDPSDHGLLDFRRQYARVQGTVD